MKHYFSHFFWVDIKVNQRGLIHFIIRTTLSWCLRVDKIKSEWATLPRLSLLVIIRRIKEFSLLFLPFLRGSTWASYSFFPKDEKLCSALFPFIVMDWIMFSPKFIHWSISPLYLRRWLYLRIRVFKKIIKIRSLLCSLV